MFISYLMLIPMLAKRKPLRGNVLICKFSHPHTHTDAGFEQTIGDTRGSGSNTPNTASPFRLI